MSGHRGPPSHRRMDERTAALRVGLIGYGLAGAVFHAPFLAATPGLRLAAVVTRDCMIGVAVPRAGG